MELDTSPCGSVPAVLIRENSLVSCVSLFHGKISWNEKHVPFLSFLFFFCWGLRAWVPDVVVVETRSTTRCAVSRERKKVLFLVWGGRTRACVCAVARFSRIECPPASLPPFFTFQRLCATVCYPEMTCSSSQSHSCLIFLFVFLQIDCKHVAAKSVSNYQSGIWVNIGKKSCKDFKISTYNNFFFALIFVFQTLDSEESTTVEVTGAVAEVVVVVGATRLYLGGDWGHVSYL